MVKLDNVTEGVLDVIMIINSVRPVPLTCVRMAHQSATETASTSRLRKRQTSRALIFILMEKRTERLSISR